MHHIGNLDVDNIKEIECGGLDSSGSELNWVAGPCEHDNEPSASIRNGGYLYQLNDCQLLKKDSSSW